MNSSSDQRKSKVAAWVGTTGILGAQGALVRRYGGPGMAGFQTGFGAFVRSSTRTAFAAAPWQVRLATGVMLATGLAAKRPMQGPQGVYEIGKEKFT